MRDTELKRINILTLLSYVLLVPLCSESIGSERITNKNTFNNYVKQIRQLQIKGRKLEPLRTSQNSSDIARCMVQMRKLQPVANQLIAQGESMPLTAANLTAISAASYAKFCVSCSISAADDCDLVDKELVKAGKYLREE